MISYFISSSSVYKFVHFSERMSQVKGKGVSSVEEQGPTSMVDAISAKGQGPTKMMVVIQLKNKVPCLKLFHTPSFAFA